ncbi:MAG: cysteine synthase A [Clostridia bacterium]|nr:cysteine synthase A [Clostridia bacterium]
MLYNNITETIGNTPLLKLNNLKEFLKLDNDIYAKLEYFNPGSSVKDRPAFNMISNSQLKNGGTVIEATSGNTGIGLAIACQKFGYHIIITMPENLSEERKQILRALGALLILTPKEEGIAGAIKKAKYIKETTENSFYASQFTNQNNYMAHYNNTAPEIYRDLDGKIDFFVSGVGSGGTITGCGKFFKEKDGNIKIIAVEPFESSVISGLEKGKHGIQGIGAGFIPDILDISLIDDIIRVKTEDAFSHAQLLSKHEGLIVGLSSGAAFKAALELNRIHKNKNIVIILPDTGERYISAGIYEGA